MKDSEIVALYFASDERAVAETANQYGNMLFRLAKRFLRSREDAEECVNDTYLKAWQTIPPNRPDNLRAYLAQLCRYTAFSIIDRRDAAKRSMELVELTAEMEQCIPDKMQDAANDFLTELLNSFLEGLMPDKRRIFLRRYWYGDSIAQIAKAEHCSESRVKTMLCRIRKSLKEHLERNGERI